MALTQKTINYTDLNLVVDSLVMRNIYASQSTPADKNVGVVNTDYQGSAQGMSQVGVVLMPRLGLTRRILGSATDGDLISSASQFLTQNRTLTLELLNRIDPIVQIPQAQQGLLNYSIAEQLAYNIAGFVLSNPVLAHVEHPDPFKCDCAVCSNSPWIGHIITTVSIVLVQTTLE